MLRDDAIRDGLIKPTQADIDRMKLDPETVKSLIGQKRRTRHKADDAQPEQQEAPAESVAETGEENTSGE